MRWLVVIGLIVMGWGVSPREVGMAQHQLSSGVGPADVSGPRLAGIINPYAIPPGSSQPIAAPRSPWLFTPAPPALIQRAYGWWDSYGGVRGGARASRPPLAVQQPDSAFLAAAASREAHPLLDWRRIAPGGHAVQRRQACWETTVGCR